LRHHILLAGAPRLLKLSVALYCRREYDDIGGFEAARALNDFELNRLTFVQGPETGHQNRGMVNK
jgi:hypothetical protein